MNNLPSRKVAAAMSLPRLGFTDNLLTASRVFHGMGINLYRHSGAFWDQTIQMLLKKLVMAGNDYIITVDYDSLFDLQQVLELLRLMELSGADAIFPMQVKRATPDLMMHPHESDAYDPSQELSRALSGHFGLTVLRASSLAKLPKPWFWSCPSDEGEWEEGSGKSDADIAFWRTVNHYGWKVYQANQVRIGHMEMVVSWPMSDGSVSYRTPHDFERNGVPEDCLKPWRGGGSHSLPALSLGVLNG